MIRGLVIAACVLASLPGARADEGMAGRGDAGLAEVAVAPTVITLAAAPWEAMPAWQSAPDGRGEYLLIPAPHARFEIGGRQYAATTFGLLVREAGAHTAAGPGAAGPWRFVPEMYLRHIGPMAMQDGLLWAVEGKSPREQFVGPVRLVALDPRDWSTRKSLQRPAGSCAVHADEGGCWFMEGVQQVHGDMRGASGGESLVCVDFDGKEKFRFSAKSLAVGAPAEGWLAGTTPTPLIYWWDMDADAVYLCVVDYRGIAPNDAPLYGPRQLVRVDRASGKHAAVDADVYQSTPMADTPEEILWVRTRNENRKDRNVLYALDKRTIKVSEKGELEGGRVMGLAVDRDFLWAQQPGPEGVVVSAFSLKDLTKAANAGKAPPEETFIGNWDRLRYRYAWSGESGLRLLGGDESRVWIGRGAEVIELRDDGQCRTRDMSALLAGRRMTWPSACGSSVLYAAMGPTIFRIDADSDKVAVQGGPPKLSPDYHKFTWSGRRLWASTGDQIVSFTESLAVERRFTRGTYPYPFAASGDSAYYFTLVDKTSVLMRADAVTGQQTRVESWGRYAREWFKKTYRLDQPPPNDLWTLGCPVWMTSEGAGKMQILCPRPTHPAMDTAKWSLMLWTYDVAQDEWRDAVVPEHYEVLSGNEGLFYDTKLGAVLTYVNSRWRRLGSPPSPWFNGIGSASWRIHASDRYLYAWTPLGLWRTARGRGVE